MSVLKYRDEQGNVHVVGERGSSGGGGATLEDLSSITTVTADPTNFTGTASNVKCYELSGMRFFQCNMVLYPKVSGALPSNSIKVATLAIAGKTVVNATLCVNAYAKDAAGEHPATAQILKSGSIFLLTEEPLSGTTSASISVTVSGTWVVT